MAGIDRIGSASRPSAGTKPEVTGGAPPDDGRARMLIVSAETISARNLREIAERSGERAAEIKVVFPAFADSGLKHVMGDVDDGIAEAEDRLRSELEEARRAGIEVSAAIGDADPVIATEDALREFPAEEIIFVTRPEPDASWLEKDLFERAKQKFEPRLTHVVATTDGDLDPVEPERAPAGAQELPDAEVAGYSRNIPRLSARDIAGIFVAIVGSLVVILIAASCPGPVTEERGTSTACVAELIIAGGITLINVAHVVALTMMQGVHYRGPWERFFSLFSLIGTPVAIAATLTIATLA